MGQTMGQTMGQNNKRNMVRILVVLLLGFSFIYRKIGFHTCAVCNLYRQAIVRHYGFIIKKPLHLILETIQPQLKGVSHAHTYPP